MRQVFFLAIIVVCAAVAIQSQSPGRGDATPPPFPSGIPAHIWNGSASTPLRHELQVGHVACATTDRLVSVQWSAGALVNTTPDWTVDPVASEQANPVSFDLQQFATSYHPTAVGVATESAIVVGGVRVTGETVIEVWSFVWPTMPQPGPGNVVKTVAPFRKTVNTLYSADQGGRRYVRSIAPLQVQQGAVTHALVQFDDSGDVYSISLQNGSLSLVASPTAAGGVGPIPELGTFRHTNIEFNDHVGSGYVYIFGGRGGWLSPVNEPSTLVLLDGDRDGTIDSEQVLLPAQWDQQGWADPASYIDGWKY